MWIELAKDTAAVIKACDVVLGLVSSLMALIGTYFAIRGTTSVLVALLLWSVPVLNVGWSELTKRQVTSSSSRYRTVVFVPVTALIYSLGTGVFHQFWLPALIMVVGTAVTGCMAAQSARFGFVDTALYAAGLTLASWLNGAVSFENFSHVVGISAAGLVLSVVSANFGRSVSAARRDRHESEINRRRTEQALQQLAEAQEQLVSTARAAGMAEIAVGVLHNVGNVLNSVNVSAEVAAKSLKDSRLGYLTKVVDLIEHNRHDLPGFLTGKRGQRLPDLISLTARQIGESVENSARELRELQVNLDHIKAIIATQQSLARTTACVETFALNDVLDTVLQLNQASLDRHHIEIVQQLDQLPTLTTDRHKLIQILVNLVTNARHAVLELGSGSPLIEVRGRRLDEERVRIEVRDNGIGIDPASISELFRYGFTTKKDGHGFGLHVSANAAKMIGGTLSAQSDGPGEGATFVLEIPARWSGKEPRHLKRPADSDSRHLSL